MESERGCTGDIHQERKLRSLEETVRQISDSLERSKIAEYVDLLNHPWRLIYLNLIGPSRGVSGYWVYGSGCDAYIHSDQKFHIGSSACRQFPGGTGVDNTAILEGKTLDDPGFQRGLWWMLMFFCL